MAFFEQLGNKIQGAAKAVSSKTSEVVEVSKLNTKLNEANRTINEKYTEIGKAMFEKFLSGATVDEACVAGCNAIVELQKEIESLKEQINEAKGVKICPGCGESVDANAKFCSKCGTSCPVKEEPKAEEPVAEAPVEETAE